MRQNSTGSYTNLTTSQVYDVIDALREDLGNTAAQQDILRRYDVATLQRICDILFLSTTGSRLTLQGRIIGAINDE